MSFKSDLYGYISSNTDLVALVGDKIYPSLAPTEADHPTLIYDLKYADSVHYQGGATTLAPIRVVFVAYGDSILVCEQIMTALRSALDGFTGYMGSTQVSRVKLESESDSQDWPTEFGVEYGHFNTAASYHFWLHRSTSTGELMVWEDDVPMLWEDGVDIVWQQ